MVDLLKIMIKWRKPILLSCGIAILGSSIITLPFLMPPYYESVSVFYPSNPSLSDKQNIFGEGNAYFFGSKEDVDRLLSIANSMELKKYVIDKYRLMEHYDINPDKTKYPNYKLMLEFEDNYKAIKNDLGGIQIKLLDTKNNMAAEIVNDIVMKIDETNQTFISSSQIKIVTTLKTEIENKNKKINSLSDSMFFVRNKYKLVDQGIQGIGSSLQQTNFEEYAKGVEKYRVLENDKKGLEKEINKYNELYYQYEAAINNKIPSLYIVEKAFPAERKTKPIRWLIVTGSAMLMLFLASLIAVIIEKYKDIKFELINA